MKYIQKHSLYILISIIFLASTNLYGDNGTATFSSIKENKDLKTREVTASYIIDGDTFVTSTGERIRLLGINTPETAKPKSKNRKPLTGQPFSQVAKKTLSQLIKGKKVLLEIGSRPKDKYKRTLAHVYRKSDNLWINQVLIKKGMAHVYSFKDNRRHLLELHKSETITRKNKEGIWSIPRWEILSSDNIPDSKIGTFNLVSGQIVNISKGRHSIYLNFGKDWKSDFTIEIPKKHLKTFKQSGITPQKYYLNKTVLVRGYLKPINGTLITATHPEQIQIIKNN